MAKRIMRWTGAAADHAWGTVGNWEADGAAAAAIPISGDDVWIQQTSQAITAGLDQTGIVLDLLVIEQNFTGTIGDADTYLVIGAKEVRIGENFDQSAPAGAQRIKLHLEQTDANACDVTVWNSSSSSADTYLPPIQMLVQHIDSGEPVADTGTLKVMRGRVGVAVSDPGNETSDLVSVECGYVNSVAGDARIDIGPGVTVQTVTKTGGDCKLRCAATTVTNREGTLTTIGTGAITTLTTGGGTVTCNSTGTITTLAANGGSSDFTKSREARTVTNCTRRGAGQISYESDVVTFTNPIDTSGAAKLSAA